MNPFDLPPHFVVGNVHKVAEIDENSCSPKLLWIRTATPKFNKYEGRGVDPGKQLGVIIQGDFGPNFCSLGGLGKMNNFRIHKTLPVKRATSKVDFGFLSGEFFFSNIKAARSVQV